MATLTFSSLPAEIHASIARHCDNGDLIKLCLTSRWVSERCLHVLYHYVDLLFNPEHPRSLDFTLKRQQQFIHTLLSHSEHGKHVRFFKGTFSKSRVDGYHCLEEDMAYVEEWGRAMQSLTHVQSVDMASDDYFSPNRIPLPATQLPTDLFQSATSVRLTGRMEYGLAKSILNAINPATLKHLCLDMVQEHWGRLSERGIMPGEKGEDGRILAFGVMSGLLTTLTGRCTALRTLILRRAGQNTYWNGWHETADKLSYVEWASFIHSVQGTVEEFVFEQAGCWSTNNRPERMFMDERFQRLVFPAIVSGNWPCLNILELRGVGGSNGPDGKAALKMELRAVLGENTKILVMERSDACIYGLGEAILRQYGGV